MENIPHTTGRMTRSRARQSSQTPHFGRNANTPATGKPSKTAFFSGGDVKPITPRRALFDISNQHSPAPKTNEKATPKPAEATVQEAKSSPVKEAAVCEPAVPEPQAAVVEEVLTSAVPETEPSPVEAVNDCAVPKTEESPVEEVHNFAVSEAEPTPIEEVAVCAAPAEEVIPVEEGLDCAASEEVATAAVDDVSATVEDDENIELPVERDVTGTPEVDCMEEDAMLCEEAAPAPERPATQPFSELEDEIVLDFAAMGTPAVIDLQKRTHNIQAAPEMLSYARGQPRADDSAAEASQEADFYSAPTPSAQQDRWAMESPYERTTPGTWAAGFTAEEDVDTACMPASSVVPTPNFDPRSLKSLRNAIKEAAAAKAGDSEIRHNEWADGDWEDGEEEDEAEEYDEDGEWDEYGYEDAAEDVEDICQILGAMGLAGEQLRSVPVPQGHHIRFEEEKAVVSPGRSRVVLRGVPEPEGTHVVFN